jgi:uncharacterized protein YggU (UPF0235/DUF167 family)
LDAVLTVALRVKPGSSRTRVGGSYLGRYGEALVVAVTAAAVDGKATEAAIAAVATAVGVPRNAITVRVGLASRDKLIDLVGPDDLVDKLARLRAAE